MLTHTTAADTRVATRERRLLLVVDDTCGSPDLCAAVRRRAGGQAIEAYVIAPSHGTAATRWYIDEEAARAEATRRLRTCLRCLRHGGIRVRGELGDPDAVQAIADALARFPADEIVLVTAPRRPSGWLRQNVIERARGAFPQPITHVVIPHTSSGGPHARPGDSRQPTRLNPRDRRGDRPHPASARSRNDRRST